MEPVIWGRDESIQKAIETATFQFGTSDPIIIYGEEGVGKKFFCEYIHLNSSRKDHSFKVFDCTVETKIAEDQLFGFRDRTTGRFQRGLIEKSNGGTLVFRNLDQLDIRFQSKILKIIKELVDYDIDVRFMATSTKSLSKLVRSGKLIKDFYDYFEKNAIHLLPLRERKEDIPLIIENIALEWAKESSTPTIIDPPVLDRFKDYFWSKNIEELKVTITNALNLESGTLTEKAVQKLQRYVSSHGSEDEKSTRLMSLKEAEKLLIKQALIHTSENRTKAAKILGVSIRTLRNKINEYKNEGASYFLNLR